jgi:hypothetical protein
MGGDPGGLRVPSALAREGSPEMLADGLSAGSAAACRRLPSGLGIAGVIAVAAVVPDPARRPLPRPFIRRGCPSHVAGAAVAGAA